MAGFIEWHHDTYARPSDEPEFEAWAGRERARMEQWPTTRRTDEQLRAEYDFLRTADPRDMGAQWLLHRDEWEHGTSEQQAMHAEYLWSWEGCRAHDNDPVIVAARNRIKAEIAASRASAEPQA